MGWLLTCGTRPTLQEQRKEGEQTAALSDFISMLELFSHHKSVETAQLFLWWTPEGAEFTGLLFSPLNGVCHYSCLISVFGAMKSRYFFTSQLFC